MREIARIVNDAGGFWRLTVNVLGDHTAKLAQTYRNEQFYRDTKHR